MDLSWAIEVVLYLVEGCSRPSDSVSSEGEIAWKCCEYDLFALAQRMKSPLSVTAFVNKRGVRVAASGCARASGCDGLLCDGMAQRMKSPLSVAPSV